MNPAFRRYTGTIGAGLAVAALLTLFPGCGSGEAPLGPPGGGEPAPQDTLRPPDPGLSWVPGCFTSLPVDNRVGGSLPPDAIPALLDPAFLTVEEAEYVNDPDRVFGVEIERRFYAFPRKVMNWHEVATFSVGEPGSGSSIRTSVTWCPLTLSFVEWRNPAWEDAGALRVHSFGVSGSLLDNNLILYDRQTRSTWPQLTGLAIAGPSAGACLAMGRNAVETTWGFWRRLHPETLVLTNRNEVTKVDPSTYAINPYAEYWAGRQDPPEPVTHDDRRLGERTIVLGVHAAEASVAVMPADRPVSTAEFGGIAAVFFRDAASSTVFAFENRVDGTARTFVADGPDEQGLPRFRDRGTGSLWTIDGVAVEGPLAGRRLAQLPAVRVYWFAWATLFPGTPVVHPR